MKKYLWVNTSQLTCSTLTFFVQSYNKALVKLKLRKPETDLGDENLER